jgi:hypothetical protein
VLVQHTSGDAYWAGRTSYYNITAMPTVAGDGVQDVWPVSWLEDDFQAHTLVYSPLTITLTENGEGDFTATIVAEEDVTDARLCMAATLDEYVPANGGGQSHLPYHVVHMMTATSGDAFAIAAGETITVNKPFTVQPEWNYEDMGVACWVQVAGGTNTSPCPYPDLPIKNRVLQSAFIEAGGTGVQGGETPVASLSMAQPSPNPFREASTLSFTMARAGHVRVEIIDLAGRRVTEIVNRSYPAGDHQVTWRGTDDRGEPCASGVYFVRAALDGREWRQRKLVILR